MKLLDIFNTAGTNLLRSKLRTFLTVVAIFIGSFTLTITSGIGSGISTYIDHQLGNLGATNILLIRPVSIDSSPTGTPNKYDANKKTVARGGFQGAGEVLTQVDLDKIKAHPGVTAVLPQLAVAIDYIQGVNNDKWQLSVSPNIRGTNLDLAAGADIKDDSTQFQIILPLSYVSSLGFSNASAAIGKPVTLGLTNSLGGVKQQVATVVGVQQKGIIGGGGATINATLTQKLYDLQSEGLPEAIRGKYQLAQAVFDKNLTPSRITNLKSDLKAQGYEAQTVQDQIGTIKTVISGIIGVLNTFAIIALLAASFGIINTLLMAVQERTKEIGLMKAMGMGGGRIFLLFSAEAIMIGFWGSLLGVAVAFAVGSVADHILSNGFLKDLPGLQIVAFPIQSIATIMLIIMGIAFLAGTLPARRAAKLSAIDALRYE